MLTFKIKGLENITEENEFFRVYAEVDRNSYNKIAEVINVGNNKASISKQSFSILSFLFSVYILYKLTLFI